MKSCVFSRPFFSTSSYIFLATTLLSVSSSDLRAMATLPGKTTDTPSVYKRCNMKKFSSDNVKIEGLVGVFPREMLRFIIHLKKAAQTLQTGINTFPSFWKNRNTMLLHGRYGNGQHTIARTIAEQTNSTLFEYSFSEQAGIRESLESYQARDDVQALFAKAKEHVITHKQPVVIFIENIHTVGEDFWKNPKLPMGALWLELDGIVDNQNIVVITTSKTCRFISEPFIDRLGGKVMKINNPNEEMRFELVQAFWNNLLKETPLDNGILATFVDMSDGLSIREIEEVFQKAAHALLSGEINTIDEDFLLQQIGSIQGKSTRALVRELCEKAKQYKPTAIKAIVIIGAILCGAKIVKKFGTKTVGISKEEAANTLK